MQFHCIWVPIRHSDRHTIHELRCLWAVPGGTKSIQAFKPNLLVVVSPKPLFLLVSAVQLTELWNPPFIVRGWGPAVTDRKDCRIARLPSKSPASLHLLGSFWVEVCLSVTLGATQKAVPHLCQPVSAIPSRTSAGLLLATCSHSSWFLRWCPISVRDWFTPVAPLKALANHTLEKPHLRYFSMSCTAVRHKGTRTGWAFSSFSPDCSAAVKRITAPHPKGCWTFSCQALSISKDGGFDTLSEQPFEWLSSYFHVPVTVIHSLVLQPC